MSEEKNFPNPSVIYDPIREINYIKGRFLGKGGFGRCCKIINPKIMRSYALKIIDRRPWAEKGRPLEEILKEVFIHRTLHHKNVVEFHSFFQDDLKFYLVLELCNRKTMRDMLEKRKTLTEIETRFYITQIIEGVQYLHNQGIIHRDLKLDNVFLKDDLQVKIGDFGLSIKIKEKGEKMTAESGISKYYAPTEQERIFLAHDIWAVGCIMYQLLMGKLPFALNYQVSEEVSLYARNMLMVTLKRKPTHRPPIGYLIKHEFLTKGFCPPSLPISCLTEAPSFDAEGSINMNIAVPASTEEQDPCASDVLV